MPTPLSELLTRFRNGDTDALTEAVRDHRPALEAAVRIALRPDNTLRPLVTTNDILQSVLLRLDRERRRAGEAAPGSEAAAAPAEPIRNGRAYLIQIATRLVIDKARRHSLAREVDGNAVLDFLADPSPAAVAEQRDAVRSVLDQLAPEDREAAKRLADGEAWGEIAGADAGTVRRRLRRRWAALTDPTAPEGG